VRQYPALGGSLRLRAPRPCGSPRRACRVDHPLFVLVGIFDRNVLRYRWPVVSRRVERLDRAPGRVKWLGPASFYMRIVLRKAVDTPG
jgi:hypothetical protein